MNYLELDRKLTQILNTDGEIPDSAIADLLVREALVAKKRADREGISSYLDSYLDRQESKKRTASVDSRFLQNVMRTTFSSGAAHPDHDRESSSSRRRDESDRYRSSRRRSRSQSRSRSRSRSRDRHRRRRGNRSLSRDRRRSRSPVASSSSHRYRAVSRSPSPKRQKIDVTEHDLTLPPTTAPPGNDEFGPAAPHSSVKSDSAEEKFADDPDDDERLRRLLASSRKRGRGQVGSAVLNSNLSEAELQNADKAHDHRSHPDKDKSKHKKRKKSKKDKKDKKEKHKSSRKKKRDFSGSSSSSD
eukprot:TRINITY_DN5969_c0_g1_i1.p1 TRINITY_DN5969_c0_g1~~TRINITY_DN5969_c0_g1_i1.p1  ORF type:complete len:302 (+),score=36.20 TRINITY_DN5969_c0_g1_i1:34-939(+)